MLIDMGEVIGPFPEFLNREVTFPDGSCYELLDQLTNLRECQDGIPAESRILFTCRQVKSGTSQSGNDEGVIKIKVQ